GLSTGADSFAVISLPDESQFKLKENSRVVLHVPAPIEHQPTVIELVSGALFSAVRKRDGQNFQVKAKAAVAGVRGTEFFASVGEKDALWLCVHDGAVDVTSTTSKKTVSVPEGLGILVESGKEPGAPKAYEWTKKLNWKMEGDVEDHSQIEMEYKN